MLRKHKCMNKEQYRQVQSIFSVIKVFHLHTCCQFWPSYCSFIIEKILRHLPWFWWWSIHIIINITDTLKTDNNGKFKHCEFEDFPLYPNMNLVLIILLNFKHKETFWNLSYPVAPWKIQNIPKMIFLNAPKTSSPKYSFISSPKVQLHKLPICNGCGGTLSIRYFMPWKKYLKS